MNENKTLTAEDLTYTTLYEYDAPNIKMMIVNVMQLAIDTFADKYKAYSVMQDLDKWNDLICNYGVESKDLYFSNTLNHLGLCTFDDMIIINSNTDSIWYRVHLGSEYSISTVTFPPLEEEKKYKIYDYGFCRNQTVVVRIAIPDDADVNDYIDVAEDNIENVSTWDVECGEWELDDYYLQDENLTKDRVLIEEVLNDEDIRNDEY